MTNEAKRNEDTVEPLVRLSSSFTQIEMDPLDRDAAVRDAHSRMLSPHEWTWTPWQQARMALYVLWASQRIAAMRYLAEGRALEHEPEKRTACRDCGLPGPFRGGLCAGCADAMDAEEPHAPRDGRVVARTLSFLPTNRRQTDMKWRVKYWRWINEQAGEWYKTGLMTKENAEKVAESFRQSHEQVEVYYDDDGKGLL